jgi:hypothetical protein
MARSNGGIIGTSNQTSFGKCTVTTTIATGSTTLTTQPGTRVVSYAVVAGGGGGGSGPTPADTGFSGGGSRWTSYLRIIFSLWSNTIFNNSWRGWSCRFSLAQQV